MQYYSIKTCKLTKYVIWGRNKMIWTFQSQQVQEFKLSVHWKTTKENRLAAGGFKLKVRGSTCQKKLNHPPSHVNILPDKVNVLAFSIPSFTETCSKL